MVNAVNNCLGLKIKEKALIEVGDVLKQSKKLNDLGLDTCFGTETGMFHHHALNNALKEKGYRLDYFRKNQNAPATHSDIAELKAGKYIIIGYTKNNGQHAVAVDAENGLLICDTARNFYKLNVDILLTMFPWGLGKWGKVFKLVKFKEENK